MSEPKTPAELADTVLPIPDNDVGREYLAAVFANRDEQIRQQERARVRAVLLDRRAELREIEAEALFMGGAPPRESLRTVATIASDLDIDLEATDV